MVEVFKTNISEKNDAEMVLDLLFRAFPLAVVNFDLEDVDNILRVEGESHQVDLHELKTVVEDAGFSIEVLEDHQIVEDFYNV